MGETGLSSYANVVTQPVSFIKSTKGDSYKMEGSKLLELYRQMYLMRRFEEEAAKAYTEKKIAGFLHLYIGQEAVATGVLAATEKKDYIVSAYRDHAHYLARGGSAREGMSELFGKATGCSKGRGGSMHFFDVPNNFMGGHGIIGAHVPLATGFGFASNYRNEGAVAVCFLGEGATSIGPFHEGLCLASLYNLPVVFVIENNGYAMGTPQSRQMIAQDVSIRALAYPMARGTYEGYDVEECFEVGKEAIERARNGGGPTLLEFKTYRHRGHSMADPGKYRSKEEVEDYKKNYDPITLLQARLDRDFSAISSQTSAIRAEVEQEVLDAVAFADSSPFPDESTVEHYTYVD